MTAYGTLIRHLLPRGPCWPENEQESPVWDSLIEALAAEPARVHADAERIASIWIDIPDEYLDMFERLFGLERGSLSDSARRTQINAWMAANRGISQADMQAIVDAYGVGGVITVGAYPLFLCTSDCNATVYGEQWLATFTVTYPGPADTAFEAAIRAAAPPNNTVLFVVT